MKKIMMILNLMLILLLGTGTVVFADAMAYDVEEAGYYVYVATPDGGLNMRHGPGTEYDRVMNYRIPDGVKLYIGYTSDNWGLTTYDGNRGWVALKQTTTTPPAPKKTPTPTPAPTPAPVATEEQIPIETEKQLPDATEEVQNTELAVPTQSIPEDTQEADSQTIERIMKGQIGLVAILVILIIIIAVLLVIIINSKSKKN